MVEVYARLRAAVARLAVCSAAEKDGALRAVRDALHAQREDILRANAQDLARAREAGLAAPLVARLALSEHLLEDMLRSLTVLSLQRDPIGEIIEGYTLANGLEIRKVRVPLGVVAVIYESRPNVTVDAFALAYKSGNAVLLRAGSAASYSNAALLRAIHVGLKKAHGVVDAVAVPPVLEEKYGDVDHILRARGFIDAVFPRGGAELIRRVVEGAHVPVIETGCGVCHLYVDESANIDVALQIAENAKLQKPAACNSVETLLVHCAVARPFLHRVQEIFATCEETTRKPGGVDFFCDAESFSLLTERGARKNVFHAQAETWDREYLDYQVSVRVVPNLEEALRHIARHSTKHSEVIVTRDRARARRFHQEVDAACVYVNASSRFTDGGQFGMGAEIGVSTQKLHARGPMGLCALTTSKYLIDGEGQVRP